jgi:hypothetical protein
MTERIVRPLGLRVDQSSPWADARLPEGSLVHAIDACPTPTLRIGPATGSEEGILLGKFACAKVTRRLRERTPAQRPCSEPA